MVAHAYEVPVLPVGPPEMSKHHARRAAAEGKCQPIRIDEKHEMVAIAGAGPKVAECPAVKRL